MKINIVYKEEKGWFVGHIQEYPDYESQGKTLEELRENLIEIYDDISKGLAPDAEPFQVLEKASLRESLRDYRRDASNKRVNQTPNTIALQDGGLGGAGYP